PGHSFAVERCRSTSTPEGVTRESLPQEPDPPCHVVSDAHGARGRRPGGPRSRERRAPPPAPAPPPPPPPPAGPPPPSPPRPPPDPGAGHRTRPRPPRRRAASPGHRDLARRPRPHAGPHDFGRRRDATRRQRGRPRHGRAWPRGLDRLHGEGPRVRQSVLRPVPGDGRRSARTADARRLLQHPARRTARGRARRRHRGSPPRPRGSRAEDRLMRRAITLLLTAALCALPAIAGAFTVTGRFLYEDRMWDKDGYTGAVQNLPIRHA